MFETLRFCVVLVACGWLVGAAPSQAAPVTVPLTGQVTFVANVPGVAVAVGDRVAGRVAFDSRAVAPDGFGQITLDGDGLVFDLAGLLTLTAADDADFGGGLYPLALFQDGELVGLDFEVGKLVALGGLPASIQFGISGLSFAWRDPFGTTLVAGDLQVVPVPAALPLFATAVAGLALWRRRRSA